MLCNCWSMYVRTILELPAKKVQFITPQLLP
jgi:hypothetical protein